MNASRGTHAASEAGPSALATSNAGRGPHAPRRSAPAATVLALLALSGCASAAPHTAKSPDTAASAAPAASGTRPAAPLADEVVLRDFGEPERALLCGPGPLTSGAATFESVLRRVQIDEHALLDKATAASQAADADCQDAVDTLRNTFRQLAGSSRSLCDYQVARGIGVGGEDLVASTAVLRGEIDQRVATIAQGDGKACHEQVGRLTADLDRWVDERNRLCAATPAQRALSACGVESTDTSQRQRAKSYCDGLAASNAPDQSLERPIEQCISAARLAPPASSRAAGGGAAGGAEGARFSADEQRFPIAGVGLQTALLRGAADFFAERAEQELSLFAYDIVKDRLCEDKVVKPYLKNTCALLESEETLAPTAATIRAAVRADFEVFPTKLVDELRGPAPPDRAPPKNAALACTTALAWSFGEIAIEGVDLLDLLGNPSPVLDGTLVRDRGCRQSVRDRIATVAEELAKLLANRPRLERDVKAGRFEHAVSGDANTRSIGGRLNEYGQVLKDVMLRVRRLDQALSAWERNPSAENRAAAVIAGLRTLDPIVRFAVEHEPGFDAAARALAMEHMSLSIELTGHILNHEYAAAVITGSQLATASGIDTGTSRNLLGLAASLAQAESSDDVRNTLNEAALPLGSWRRKNERRWGATLTGLVGAQLAHEIVVEKAPRPTEGGPRPSVESGASLSPSLIVGADLHHGLGKGFRGGLQFSLLDLGALLTFRMDHPEVEEESAADEQSVDGDPELRVQQVFSPGLYPYLGWGPLDLGVGASFVPALRSLDTPDDSRALDVFRLGVFLAVDVSVLPLL